MQAIDELRRRAHLLQDLLLQPGALRLEALGAAEDLPRAILLPAFEQGHAEVHEVRRGRAEVGGLREEVDGVAEIAALEVDPAEGREGELLELLRRVAERELRALDRLDR